MAEWLEGQKKMIDLQLKEDPKRVEVMMLNAEKNKLTTEEDRIMNEYQIFLIQQRKIKDQIDDLVQKREKILQKKEASKEEDGSSDSEESPKKSDRNAGKSAEKLIQTDIDMNQMFELEENLRSLKDKMQKLNDSNRNLNGNGHLNEPNNQKDQKRDYSPASGRTYSKYDFSITTQSKSPNKNSNNRVNGSPQDLNVNHFEFQGNDSFVDHKLTVQAFKKPEFNSRIPEKTIELQKTGYTPLQYITDVRTDILYNGAGYPKKHTQ